MDINIIIYIYLEDLGVNVRIILKLILKCVKVDQVELVPDRVQGPREHRSEHRISYKEHIFYHQRDHQRFK
jgi:hypothetical protein